MLTTYIGIQRDRKQSDGCQGLSIGENWEQLPTGYRGRIFFWVMKMLWNWLFTQPHEWTTGYEMLTFTWVVWYYVNFISKGKKKIRMETRNLTGWERGAHFIPVSWGMDAKRTFTHLVYWYRDPEDAEINSASVVREAFTKVSIWAKP